MPIGEAAAAYLNDIANEWEDSDDVGCCCIDGALRGGMVLVIVVAVSISGGGSGSSMQELRWCGRHAGVVS